MCYVANCYVVHLEWSDIQIKKEVTNEGLLAEQGKEYIYCIYYIYDIRLEAGMKDETFTMVKLNTLKLLLN